MGSQWHRRYITAPHWTCFRRLFGEHPKLKDFFFVTRGDLHLSHHNPCRVVFVECGEADVHVVQVVVVYHILWAVGISRRIMFFRGDPRDTSDGTACTQSRPSANGEERNEASLVQGTPIFYQRCSDLIPLLHRFQCTCFQRRKSMQKGLAGEPANGYNRLRFTVFRALVSIEGGVPNPRCGGGLRVNCSSTA